MPTYEYQCTECEKRLEVDQRFTDEPLTTCEACGGPLRKVFSAVGVVFKGSGFYKTDSRPSAPKESSTKGTSESSDSAKSTESSSTPAVKESAATAPPAPTPAAPATTPS